MSIEWIECYNGVMHNVDAANDHAPRYRVEIPFHAAANGRLGQPCYELPDGARIEQHLTNSDTSPDEQPRELLRIQETFGADGLPLVNAAAADGSDESFVGKYRFCVTITASNAEEAVVVSETAAKALLSVLAANQMAFEIGAPKDRRIKRLDPPTSKVPDTELPFDTINMRNKDEAVLSRIIDPTGQFRRAGKIFMSNSEASVKRPSLALEGELYLGRHDWDVRIPKAAEIYRLAQCSEDATVRFLLSCLAFEVLVAHVSTPVLNKHLAQKSERTQLIKAVDGLLSATGLPEDACKRVTERVRTTEAQSYTLSAVAYLDSLRLPVPAENFAWIQKQRGGFVHAGALQDSAGAVERRNDFIKIVGVALLREMAHVVGRRVDDLTPGISFTLFQVWDWENGGEPTLTVK